MELVFNEVEFYADHTDPTENEEPELTISKAPKQKKHATNKEKLPENIETEVVIRDAPEIERVCPQCGTQMRPIGEDVVRRLKIVPAKVVIVETHLPRYACANCEQNDVTTPVCIGTGCSRLSSREHVHAGSSRMGDRAKIRHVFAAVSP